MSSLNNKGKEHKPSVYLHMENKKMHTSPMCLCHVSGQRSNPDWKLRLLSNIYCVLNFEHRHAIFETLVVVC